MNLDPTIDALKSSLELLNNELEKVTEEQLKKKYLVVIEKVEKAIHYIDEMEHRTF
ncbi:hypothetical protein [Brumimicrobium glaciale]|jgi:GTPase involved in cell partitioning and DNA repair|uniref:hypothetical protein n=1 Tax=Brumimicrobium glaciale TaxID=200475 RepID=UPI0013EACE92|nr:hypothetical protein [Brumimicrobium glaciale]